MLFILFFGSLFVFFFSTFWYLGYWYQIIKKKPTEKLSICLLVSVVIGLISGVAIGFICNYETVETNRYELVEIDKKQLTEDESNFVYVSTIKGNLNTKSSQFREISYEDVTQKDCKPYISEYTTYYTSSIPEGLYEFLTLNTFGKVYDKEYKVFIPNGTYEKTYLISK